MCFTNGVIVLFFAFPWSNLRLFLSHLNGGPRQWRPKAAKTHERQQRYPRWRRQAERTAGTKPPENPSSENPTTKITPQQRQKPKSPQTQPDIKTQQPQPYTNTNKRNQSTTNQVNGLKSLNKPRAKTRQTLNKSEKPNWHPTHSQQRSTLPTTRRQRNLQTGRESSPPFVGFFSAALYGSLLAFAVAAPCGFLLRCPLWVSSPPS